MCHECVQQVCIARVCVCVCVCSMFAHFHDITQLCISSVQLLHKLSIRAVDGPQKLLKVISTSHLVLHVLVLTPPVAGPCSMLAIVCPIRKFKHCIPTLTCYHGYVILQSNFVHSLFQPFVCCAQSCPGHQEPHHGTPARRLP